MTTFVDQTKSRFDLIIYSHDGRGLGHTSRSVAIGLAVQRLAPELKVMLITGCKETGILIDSSTLDWIKLPSYEIILEENQLQSCSNIRQNHLSNLEISKLRSKILLELFSVLQPRCVLVDHIPGGKREELCDCLKSFNSDIIWILGVRAVVGKLNGDIWYDRATNIFNNYYKGLFWYGDTNIHGLEIKQKLQSHFNVFPYETGLISRINELEKWGKLTNNESEQIIGTVAFSWCSEDTLNVLENLLEVFQHFNSNNGKWLIFLGQGSDGDRKQKIIERFHKIPFCHIKAISNQYLTVLRNSKVALVYAGYNTLTDLLWAKIPAIVLIRDFPEKEQEDHVRLIIDQTKELLLPMEETQVCADSLYQALQKQMSYVISDELQFNLNGAETAANFLIKLINQNQ